MARKEIVSYVVTDDLTGEEIPEQDAERVSFTYGGTSYELDLSKKNASKLDDFLAPYIDAAKTVRRSSSVKGSKKKSSEDLDAIRTWAKAQGFTVADRGRVAQEIKDRYYAAN